MLFARNADDEIFTVVVIVCSAIMFLAGLAMQFLFLLTLKRALEQCDPRTRTMEPGQVFLNLIPCFGAIWMFFTVSRVSESLRAEYDDRGMDAYGDYGQQMGISYASLILAWIIPWIGVLFGIAGFVCWIMYWMKIAELSRGLREGESYRGEYRDYTRRRREEQRGYDRDDEENDSPQSRRRTEDDDDDRSSRRGRPPEAEEQDDDYDDRPRRRRDED